MAFNFRLKSLASRIISLVLIILIAFSIAIGFISYSSMRNQLEDITVQNLEALAAAREQALETQIMRFEEVVTGFKLPNLEAQLEDFLTVGGAEKIMFQDELINSLMRSMQASNFIIAAQIVDRDNRIIVQTNPDALPFLETESDEFESARRTITISTPFFLGTDYLVNLATPLQDSNHRNNAILIVRKKADRIRDLTSNFLGQGESGETIVGQARQDSVYFIAPFRGDPSLSIVKPVSVTGVLARPLINATLGQTGVIRNTADYAGKRVIAAHRPITSQSVSGWGLVLKMDIDEAFAPVNRLRSTLLIALLVLLIIAGAIVIPLATSFVKPLNDLNMATERVALGKLDTHVPIATSDEIGKLGIAFNIMIDKLQLTRDELVRSNQELSSFAYVVSHDLKAPLRGISSLSSWLADDLSDKLEEEQLTQLGLLQNRVRRMDALINGLLEYSRVGKVKNPEVMTRVDELVIWVIDILDPPDNITITVESPLPVIMVDELRLSQVFQNLLSNAISYHPGPDGEIIVGCKDAGDLWEFFVSDDGDGIEPRYHDRIFAMFQSLQTRDDIDSTGVGLALVKKIVEDHDGDVRVESDGVQGKGATFRFTWPKNMKEA